MKLVRGAFALLPLLALTMFTPSAHATLQLRISDGTNSVDITDQLAGDSCVGAVNVDKLCFIGSVGNWDLTVTTGRSKGAAFPFSIDLNGSSQLIVNDLTTLTVQLSDNNFTPVTNGETLHIGGTLANGATLVASAFGGTTNTKFDLSNQIGSNLSFTDPPAAAFSGSTGGSFVGSNPYGLTIQTTLTFVRGTQGLVTYDANLDPVPEPASMALLGGVLLISAGAIRRKMRRS